MKIGIFLGYGPQVKLNKEGLGRYIGGLMKGFLANGEEVTIACPNWLLDSVKDLLKSFSINEKRINWITTRTEPPLWRIYNYINKPRQKLKLKEKLWKYVDGMVSKTLDEVAVATNFFSIIGYIAPRVLLALLCFPFFLVGSVLYVMIALLKKGILFFKKKLGLTGFLTRIQKDDIGLRMFLRMNNAEILRLIDLINSKEKKDVWFVPSLFWPQVNNIKSTVVINAPDLVSQKYAEGFADVYNAENAIMDCRKTLETGTYFVTYCAYLQKTLLIDDYRKPLQYTAAVPHVNNDMMWHIAIDPALGKQIRAKKDLVNAFCDSLLRGLIAKTKYYECLRDIRWDAMKYIFFPSQIRPSKNIMTLVQAYEYLLREKYIAHKLFLTCDPHRAPNFEQYLEDHKLYNDVVCFYDVPAQQLAALYRRADLVVNPTLYEGGFPFTFGEGMSVGTPSLMSRIPQVEDVLKPAGLEEVMFDPYNWRDMADKIEYWLPKTEELYQKELPLYKELEKRTPDVVAAEYVEAFKRFITLDQTANEKA